jgi:hypothetical protein
MPSANRFAFLRGTVRNHPVTVATSAATGGVLLGVFVAIQLLATPKPHSDVAGAGTAQAAVETKAKPMSETTGSAPTAEGVASAECEQQTWPHLSRACIDDYRNKNRSPRVVSTDKLDKPAIAAVEASPPASTDASGLAAPATWAPSVAFPAPLAVAPPVKTASVPPPAPEPASAATAAPEPPVAATTDAPATSQAAKNEMKEKRIAKKVKRKAKAPVKQDVGDDDSAVASGDSDDRASDDRAERRPDRSRRVVERWTERDYDVPDSRGNGERRVTVIRRGGGGLFESFFGN